MITCREVVIIPSSWAEGVYYTNLPGAACLHRQRMFDAIFLAEMWVFRVEESETQERKRNQHLEQRRRNHCSVSLVSYLNAGGRHLRRLVIDPESVPACGQRVVADQVLDRCVLDLRGVKVDAPVGITQSLMASRVTLRR